MFPVFIHPQVNADATNALAANLGALGVNH